MPSLFSGFCNLASIKILILTRERIAAAGSWQQLQTLGGLITVSDV